MHTDDYLKLLLLKVAPQATESCCVLSFTFDCTFTINADSCFLALCKRDCNAKTVTEVVNSYRTHGKI